MKTFLDVEAVLAQTLPGYEPRQPQQRLAAAIEEIFDHKPNFTRYDGPEEEYRDWERPDITHLLGQAGTGTGKSLAYMIPALLSGKRVIVSVTTKALQDQIVTTDLPFLSEHLDREFSWALLKGRGNYLCLNRLGTVTENDAEASVLRAIWEASQDPTFSGIREDIKVDIPDRVWSLIASESEECSANKCTSAQCYAEKARTEASNADLVIANHSLFFTDLKIKTYGLNGMLGEYDLVIFDEAHSLEDVAGNVLGDQLSEGTFSNWTAQVRRWGSEHDDDEGNGLVDPIGNVTACSQAFFGRVADLFKDDRGNGRLRTSHLNELVGELEALYSSIETLRAALAATTYDSSAEPTKAGKRRWSLVRRAYSLMDRLGEVIAAPPNEIVRWVETEERRGQKRVVVKTAPILVAPFLRRNLFTKTPCVLVSATLAVKGSMEYIAGRLGVHGAYRSLDVGTPFDFPAQGRLYVPVMAPSGTPFPAPQGQNVGEWEGMALQEIHRLVTYSRGRALVLFTSIRHMRSTFESLSRMGGDLVYRMQGERGVSNRDLVDWLKAGTDDAPGRVLLATKSFFTGVDVQGDALSMLIITKMPFPVPDEPLTEARCEAIEAAGGSSFMDFSIPVMSLELQQGVGRLIRHRNDRGVAAILDPRLANKPYGRKVMADLPPMRQTFSLAEVEEFFSVEGVSA